MTTLPYFGHWHNFDNYKLCSRRVDYWPVNSWRRWPCFPTTIYERDLRPWPDGLRLTWQHPEGRYVQADQHAAFTDLGSTLMMQLWFPSTEFLRAYAFLHDPAYDAKEGHVLWFADRLEGPYHKEHVTKDQADQWLEWGAIAEGRQMTPPRPLAELERRTARIGWAVRRFGRKW